MLIYSYFCAGIKRLFSIGICAVGIVAVASCDGGDSSSSDSGQYVTLINGTPEINEGGESIEIFNFKIYRQDDPLEISEDLLKSEIGQNNHLLSGQEVRIPIEDKYCDTAIGYAVSIAINVEGEEPHYVYDIPVDYNDGFDVTSPIVIPCGGSKTFTYTEEYS